MLKQLKCKSFQGKYNFHCFQTSAGHHWQSLWTFRPSVQVVWSQVCTIFIVFAISIFHLKFCDSFDMPNNWDSLSNKAVMDSDFEAGSGYNLPIFYEIQGYIYSLPPPPGGERIQKMKMGKSIKKWRKRKKKKGRKRRKKGEKSVGKNWCLNIKYSSNSPLLFLNKYRSLLFV